VDDWIIPDWPAPAHVRAVSTTRQGGVSEGAFRGFNLALHVGDDAAAVAANREALRARIGVTSVWIEQVHGERCVQAEPGPLAQADASFTRMPQIACAVLTADCLPLLLCDANGEVVAAAHAGWRGLAGGVIEATVKAMRVPAKSLLAWLGPAIGPQVFEVGEDVRSAFVTHDAAAAQAFVTNARGRWWCDLYALARLRLARLGVEEIYGGAYCTHTDASRFFSYRREGQTGRMATLIWRDF
jgi:YfiH family protein